MRWDELSVSLRRLRVKKGRPSYRGYLHISEAFRGHDTPWIYLIAG